MRAAAGVEVGMGGIMSIFEIGIGGYLLYCAITGKGAIYDDKNVKKDQRAKYRKTMRIFSWILAGLMLPCGILEYMGATEGAPAWYMTLSNILWGASMVAIVALMVLAIRMTDRNKAGGKAVRHEAPRAAFYFDEDESGQESGKKS